MEETSRLFRRRPRKDLQAPLLIRTPEDRKRTRFHRSYDAKPTDLDPLPASCLIYKDEIPAQ